MTLKFIRVLEVVEVHVLAKFHQANCSGSWVTNTELDFGQLYPLTVNICGTDQANDKQKTALSTTIFSTFDEKKIGELWSTNEKNDLEIQ